MSSFSREFRGDGNDSSLKELLGRMSWSRGHSKPRPVARGLTSGLGCLGLLPLLAARVLDLTEAPRFRDLSFRRARSSILANLPLAGRSAGRRQGSILGPSSRRVKLELSPIHLLSEGSSKLRRKDKDTSELAVSLQRFQRDRKSVV